MLPGIGQGDLSPPCHHTSCTCCTHLTGALPAAAHSQRRKLLHKAAKGKDSAKAELQTTLPTMAHQPPTLLGCVSEAFGDALDCYVQGNPDKLLAAKGKEKDKAAKGKGQGGSCCLVPSFVPGSSVCRTYVVGHTDGQAMTVRLVVACVVQPWRA